MILLWAVIPIFFTYSILILYYWRTWKSIPVFTPDLTELKTSVSVIIPARNEEKNIDRLLIALNNQTYPRHLFEVIVIDDHSEDRTADIVRQHPGFKLISMYEEGINSYKKKAIETGIAASTGELIVTTDADCIPPPEWLETIAAFKKHTNAVFIASPVAIDCNSSLVQVFQSMDFMVLQGITGAVVHQNKMTMCNGANLSYEKNAFLEVNGFSGADHIASGDDMLLMYKIWKKHPGNVHYLKSKDAVVSTAAVTTWKEFFKQRIRWASKARSYQDKRILPVLILVYFLNLLFPVLFIAGFWNSDNWFALLALWILKTLVEFPLFISLASFFNKPWAIKYFFIFQLLHVAYTLISGLFGQFGKYEWKGRLVR